MEQQTDFGVATVDGAVLARSRRRVGMASVDAAGIIYFAAPLPWAEGLFTDWLADHGHPMTRILAHGAAFPIVESQTSYRVPLRLDDLVDLELSAAAVGERSFTMRTRMSRATDGVVAVEVRLVHVFVSGLQAQMRATTIPPWLRSCLAAGEPADREGPDGA